MINLQKILKKEPTLTPMGIENSSTFQMTNPEFDKDYIVQIETSTEWLKTKSVDNKIHRKVNSYGVKHIIERELKTSIANGCLIAAVIDLGIPYERIPGSPNIYLAIQQKELYKNDPNRVSKRQVKKY